MHYFNSTNEFTYIVHTINSLPWMYLITRN